jgi:hypothetical protein
MASEGCFDQMAPRIDRRRKLAIVSPVFNDWDAFGQLTERLGQLYETVMIVHSSTRRMFRRCAPAKEVSRA